MQEIATEICFRPGVFYTLEQLGELLAIGPDGLRAHQKRGLKMLQVGRRKFCRGEDILAYLDSLAEQRASA